MTAVTAMAAVTAMVIVMAAVTAMVIVMAAVMAAVTAVARVKVRAQIAIDHEDVTSRLARSVLSMVLRSMLSTCIAAASQHRFGVREYG